MDFSVINQCEVKLTAREATTMTPWVFVSRQIAHSSHRSQLMLVSWKQGGLEGAVGTIGVHRFTYGDHDC